MGCLNIFDRKSPGVADYLNNQNCSILYTVGHTNSAHPGDSRPGSGMHVARLPNGRACCQHSSVRRAAEHVCGVHPLLHLYSAGELGVQLSRQPSEGPGWTFAQQWLQLSQQCLEE